MPFQAWKCVSSAISSGVDISEVPAHQDRWVLREGHKNYFKDLYFINSQPNFMFLISFLLIEMAILLKGCKPDNLNQTTL